jgi:N-methylhydantoinase A
LQIGVDIGGTFTDLVVLDEATGAVSTSKALSTPRDLLDGVLRCVDQAGAQLADCRLVIHGTTIGINALLERTGAKTGLVTTEGFRDVLEIGRGNFLKMYDVLYRRPAPLVPRGRCLEVPERLGARGEILVPLDEDAVKNAARQLAAEGVESVAVVFLFSYRDPAHEQRAAEIVAREMPGALVSASHRITQEWREYERTSTTVVNAYIRPVMDRYLGAFGHALGGRGFRGQVLVTQSNGGAFSLEAARSKPVHTMESGPAAGATGCASLARILGADRLIAFDMGGTTAKCAIVDRGLVQTTDEYHADGHPVRIPVIDIKEVSAGGGTIAWIDTGGALTLGPRSAGADPGPACYGRGATEPALSDAFLLCGFLNPDNFVGGRLRLHPERSALAMRPLGEALGLDVEATAEAVIEVATSNMYVAFSNVLARHGLDPRDFALVAFGGAGPIEACFLAEEFHIPRVIVPPSPGTLCAQGAMMADLKSDYVKTIHRKLSTTSGKLLAAECADLSVRATRWLREEAPAVASSAIAHSADLRYVGQAFQIEVPIDPAWLEETGTEGLRAAFHDRHELLYAHADRAADVELIDLRATITGATPKPELKAVPTGKGAVKPAGRRPIHYRKHRYDAAVYHRRDLLAGQHVDGPAVIEQEDTTTLVPADFRASVDAFGNLVIEGR